MSVLLHHKLLRRFLVVFTSLCLIYMSMSPASTPQAYADTNCQRVTGTDNCRDFPDTGGNSIWCTQRFSGSGIWNSYMSFCLHALQITGTGDNKRYAVFNEEITQGPDTANNVQNWWWYNGGDSSKGGDQSTAHGRLWSINTRTGTRGDDQEDYIGLEPRSQCVPSGSSQTLSVSFNTPGGSASWSDSNPLTDSCFLVPSGVDQWSRYYDYSTDNYLDGVTEMHTDMTFAQWESNTDRSVTHNSFWIGASVKAQFGYVIYYGNPPGQGPYPISSGNYQDVFNW